MSFLKNVAFIVMLNIIHLNASESQAESQNVMQMRLQLNMHQLLFAEQTKEIKRQQQQLDFHQQRLLEQARHLTHAQHQIQILRGQLTSKNSEINTLNQLLRPGHNEAEAQPPALIEDADAEELSPAERHTSAIGYLRETANLTAVEEKTRTRAQEGQFTELLSVLQSNCIDLKLQALKDAQKQRAFVLDFEKQLFDFWCNEITERTAVEEERERQCECQFLENEFNLLTQRIALGKLEGCERRKIICQSVAEDASQKRKELIRDTQHETQELSAEAECEREELIIPEIRFDSVVRIEDNYNNGELARVLKRINCNLYSVRTIKKGEVLVVHRNHLAPRCCYFPSAVFVERPSGNQSTLGWDDSESESDSDNETHPPAPMRVADDIEPSHNESAIAVERITRCSLS